LEPFAITVECYAGHRGEQTPRRFRLHERTFEIEIVVDQWLAPDHRYFKVRTSGGELCILRHQVTSGEWELTLFQSPSGH
jgi:hypothetical protein